MITLAATLLFAIAMLLFLCVMGLRRDPERRRGDWMWCFSGRRFWPLDPRPEDVHLDDIAHGLANECRYAGQSLDYFSVAEHCVIVSLYVEQFALEVFEVSVAVARAWALEALLHDASEAYIGDVIRPLKYQRALRGFRIAEHKVDRAIAGHFAPWLRSCADSRQLIKSVDDQVLADEIGSLIADDDVVEHVTRHGPALGATIACLSPYQAECVFIQRFIALCPEYDQ